MDKRYVFRFTAAERETLDRGAFINTETDAGTERESRFLGVESFRFVKDDGIIGVKMLFETVDISVLDETY